MSQMATKNKGGAPTFPTPNYHTNSLTIGVSPVPFYTPFIGKLGATVPAKTYVQTA